MDLILGIIVFVITLFIQLPTVKIIKKINSSLYRRIEEFQKNHMIFSQKLLLSALAGFIVYSLFTPNVDSFLQRIAIISVAVILIYAVNIKLPSPANKD